MEEVYDSSTHLLKEPLSFAELIENGAQFEVDTSDVYVPSDEDVDVDDDTKEEEVDTESLVSPWTRTFAELRELMSPIGENMFKRITREGVKEKGLVPDKARVSLRYSAYWEGDSAPFDSSMLRGAKFEFETGGNMVLEGLEAAVRTMYPYEQSEFIISYKILFHELGCPPRIKPKADGLFKIEVIGFTLIGDEHSMLHIAPEDRTKFSVVYPKALDIHLHGKDCVQRGSYRHALRAFEGAITSLNYCRLADEKEELKQTQLLTTLYTNVMVCNNKLNRPTKVCIAMRALRHLTKGNPCCKALFQEGRALAALGEYQRARQVLLKAQAKQPNNKEISEEIIQMEQRLSKYNQSMSEMWTRAFAVKKPPQEQDPKTELKENNSEEAGNLQFKRDFESQLEEFKASSLQSLPMSRKLYTDKEFDVLCLIAAKHNMKLSMSPLDVDKLTLSKLSIK